jgi:antitoxin component YwqK of YwqJK toxin-antitoxin module
MYHGECEYVFESGKKFIGTYINGKREGLGKMFDESGNPIYIGNFKNGMYHGNGEYFFKNGLSKKGIFENNKLLNPK